jgi:hypothetical protein
MGEVKVRSNQRLDQDDIPQPGPFDERRFCRRPATRARTTMLWAAGLFLLGTLPTSSARAQDDPPKVEAPTSAPLAPADAPKGQAPPLSEVQKKGSAPPEKQKDAQTEPAEKQKDAATEPAEKQKGAPAAPEDAQKKPAKVLSSDELEAALDAAQALSSRYRFIEKYGIEDDPTRPELITQYQVGVRRTMKQSREKAQAAPVRTEWSRVCIYTERAAKVNRLGEPTDLMRRYDRVILKSLVPTPPLNPPFLQGLEVWYRFARPPLKPQVMTLNADRSLREGEYAVIAGEMSIPPLLAFFPPTPKRVNETWEIPPSAYARVSGVLPDSSDYEMTGTLLGVSKSPSGNSLVAQIDVAGHFNVGPNPSAFHARVDFTFEPAGISIPARGPSAPSDKVVVATGRITQALVSFAATAQSPDASSRAKITETHELVLQRRPLPTVTAGGKDAVTPLVLPVPAPEPTKENSWVVYDDPAGRFHFRHPEELALQEDTDPDPNAVVLLDNRPTGNAFVSLHLPTTRGDTAHDAALRDPAHFEKWLEKDFAKAKDTLTKGAAGYLDAEDWKSFNRKVYRVEFALKPEKGDPPVYYADLYLVTELSGVKRFSLQSWTQRSDHLECRNRAEDMIRSFQFVPFDKRTRRPLSKPAPSSAGPNPAEAGAPAAAPGATSPAPDSARPVRPR